MIPARISMCLVGAQAPSDIKLRLEDLLGRRVDLVLIDGLKPRVRDKILGEAIRAS